MKKYLLFALALALVFAPCPPAYAAGEKAVLGEANTAAETPAAGEVLGGGESAATTDHPPPRSTAAKKHRHRRGSDYSGWHRAEIIE